MSRRHRSVPVTVVALSLSVMVAACGTRVDGPSGDALLGAAQGGAGTVDAGAGTVDAGAGTVDAGAGTVDAGAGAADAGAGTAGAGTADAGAGTADAGAGTGPAGGSGGAKGGKVVCDPSVSGKKLVVGGTFPLSGPVGFLGKHQLAAMDTYAKWFNSRGGYCGRKMEVIALDDGMEPSKQLANMRKLNEEYKVLAAGTILTVGVGDYVTRNKIPVLALGGAIEPFSSKQPTVFPALGSAYQFTGTFIQGLMDNKTVAKGDKVALLYDTEIFNLAPIKDDIGKQWTKAGFELVSSDAFNLSNGDCSSLVNKMRSLDIDYWDFQGFGWVLCTAAATRAGWKPKKGWGGWTASSAGIPELGGRSSDGVWHGGASRIDPNYAKLMKTYHPNEMQTEADLAAPPAIGSWALMGQFEIALRTTNGNITREQLIESFQKVKKMNFMGKDVQVNFDPNCKGGTVPAPGSSFTMAQWKYNEQNERFDRAFKGGEIGMNPFIGECDASKLASQKY